MSTRLQSFQHVLFAILRSRRRAKTAVFALSRMRARRCALQAAFALILRERQRTPYAGRALRRRFRFKLKTADTWFYNRTCRRNRYMRTGNALYRSLHRLAV